MYILKNEAYDEFGEGHKEAICKLFDTVDDMLDYIRGLGGQVPARRTLYFTIPLDQRKRSRPDATTLPYARGYRMEHAEEFEYEDPASSIEDEDCSPTDDTQDISKEEILVANQSLVKKNQRLQDLNRINSKTYRLEVRQLNAIEEYYKDISYALKKVSLRDFTIKHNTTPGESPMGIVQLSDVHFNELINLQHNKYDFTVAAKRLAKLATHAKIYFNAWGVNKILIACTGDLLNNDNIPDKLLNAATNRANASVLAAFILQQFILDLNKDFEVHVTGISGNESRIKDQIGFSDTIATDNYDSLVLHILHLLFDNSDVKVFFCGHNEGLVKVNNKNILLMHGHVFKGSDVERQVQQIKGRYANRGTNIDYVLMGHVHSARIGDQYARSSSLAGANDYSEDSLNLSGRASQNIYLVDESAVHGIRIDLQDTVGIKGYNIIKELEDYNTKSHDKSLRYDLIHKI